MPTDRVHCTLRQEQTRYLQTPATAPNTTPPTRHRALHPLQGTAPVTGHCTRYEALHPLRGAAPDQNGCNAYGSGALHAQTRINAVSESPHHTRHRRTGEKSPPTPGATSTARNNTTQARTLTHLVAHGHTWWQRGPTPAHVNSPGGTWSHPPSLQQMDRAAHKWVNSTSRWADLPHVPPPTAPHPQRNEAATGYPATASSLRSASGTRDGTARLTHQAVMST